MKDFIEHIKSLDKNQLILLAAKLKKESIEQQKNEPIAIVGIGCRMPGQKEDSKNAFWQNILDGIDSTSELKDERWLQSEFYNDDIDAPGKTYVNRMSLLTDFDRFDAPFFNIHKGEADYMDPQQRWLLEVSWHALEDAGMDPNSLKGQLGGVYVGLMNHDYVHLQNLKLKIDSINGYTAMGSAMSVASGRLSYFYGLSGPSMALDTACSSSLVGVHLACQALRDGSCNFALAGGVNAIFSPTTTIAESKAQMLSKSGYCHTYDAAADGYVRSEGCGMVVLKRLSDAQKNGDRIYSVIRGSAVNQDGASQGLTAPNRLAQQEVIRQALKQAGVSADKVGYVETNGTATPLGDPIEINALIGAYQTPNRERPLLVSTHKTNMGHAESAAGIAGLIKLSLARYHNVVPKQIHFKQLNEHIQLDGQNLKIVEEVQAWHPNTPFGALSSFGFSGTNAHLILAAAPHKNSLQTSFRDEASVQMVSEGSSELIVTSAKSSLALENLIHRWKIKVKNCSEEELSRLAVASRINRAHHKFRAALPVDKESRELIDISSDKVRHNAKLAWVFSGAVKLRSDALATLYRDFSIYREAVELCLSEFSSTTLSLKELREELKAETARGAEVKNADSDSDSGDGVLSVAASFIVQYALAELWNAWGLKPEVMVAETQGELALSVVAKVMPLNNAVKLVSLIEHGKRSNSSDKETNEKIDQVFSSVSLSEPEGPVFVSDGTRSLNSKSDWLAFDNNGFNAEKACSFIKDNHITSILEIGSACGWLAAMSVTDCDSHSYEADVFANIESKEDVFFTLQQVVGKAYMHGLAVNWSQLSPQYNDAIDLDMPLYPFDDYRYWFQDERCFSLLSELSSNDHLFSENNIDAARQEAFIHELRSMDEEQQWLTLVSMTRKAIAEVLNQDEEEIPVDVDIFDLGLDSMKAMDMRSQVQNTLGYSVPATLLFDYPNVIKLVDYLGIHLLNLWQRSPIENELEAI